MLLQRTPAYEELPRELQGERDSIEETFLIEDLRTQMLLQGTPAYEELLRELQGERDSIKESFYITDAMVNREWTQEEYELRHIMTPSYLRKENLPPGQPGVHMCFVQ